MSTYTTADVRRLITQLGDLSREVALKTMLSDREVRHLRSEARRCPPSTYRLLQLTAWIDQAYPYIEEGKIVPDKLFWQLEQIVKSHPRPERATR